jgi:predicted ribosomally synthesized peptide with SipW-like signal peptide
MQRKTIFKIGALFLVLALMVASLSGISAYFTDVDSATNTFEVGEIDIELKEPNWPGEPDVNPNHTTPKDPQIYNKGKSDAFVFLEVFVPYEDNIVVAEQDGTPKDAATVELFTYATNPGWVQISRETKSENEVVRYVYAYVGDNTENLKALAHGETTTALFDEITFINVVEGQGLENTTQNILVNAYGIQTNDINGGKTDPQSVWAVITNTEITTPTEVSYNIQFGQPYVLETLEDGVTYNNEFIFYEDGSVAFYWTANTEDGIVHSGWTAPAGSCEYLDKIAIFDGIITIGENGEYIMIPMTEDEMAKATLTPVETQQLPNGEIYARYDHYKPDYIYSRADIIKLNSDGTGIVGAADYPISLPDGSVEYQGPWFKIDTTDIAFYESDCLEGHIHPDGTRLLVGEQVYIAQSVLENELGCIHLHTEHRSVDGSGLYHTLQLWCLDCETMLKDAGYMPSPI